jgi:hypothetical protein
MEWWYGRQRRSGAWVLAILPHIRSVILRPFQRVSWIYSPSLTLQLGFDKSGITCLVHHTMFAGLHLYVMPRFEIEQ